MTPVRVAFAVALSSILTILACGGDDSSSGSSSQSPIPPNGCPAEPCMAGTTCLQQPEPSCNGTWYCWSSDQKWHCAPEDAGGPGGSPPDGAFIEETGGPTDASMPNDATSGG
jgi:hypothetical protein